MAISTTVAAHETTPAERARAFAGSAWALAAVLGITVIVFAPSLAAWFISDDFWFLRGARDQGVLAYTWDALDPRETALATELNRYRPLYPIAWRLQYEVFGLQAFWYHAVAVGAHLVCCVLVWQIARRLLRPDWTAALAALVFAIHPVNAPAVAWISGNRVFSTLPALAMLLLFMRYLEGDSRRRWLALSGSIACYAVAVLMHSSAVVMLPVIVAYAYGLHGTPRDALSLPSWARFVPFAVIAAVVAVAQLYVRNHLDLRDDFSFGFHQYTAYAQYLGLLLFPPGARESDGNLGTVLGFAHGAAALTMIGLLFAVVAARPLRPVALFAAFWMVAAILPDSTLIFPPQTRALYLATVPFSILSVALLLWALEAVRSWGFDARPYAAGAVALALIAGMAVTFDRVETHREQGHEHQRFATAIRDADIRVPPGGVLYVDGAPPTLTALTPTWLYALVEVYYPGTEVRVLEATSQPGADDRVFRYR